MFIIFLNENAKSYRKPHLLECLNCLTNISDINALIFFSHFITLICELFETIQKLMQMGKKYTVNCHFTVCVGGCVCERGGGWGKSKTDTCHFLCQERDV